MNAWLVIDAMIRFYVVEKASQMKVSSVERRCPKFKTTSNGSPTAKRDDFAIMEPSDKTEMFLMLSTFATPCLW